MAFNLDQEGQLLEWLVAAKSNPEIRRLVDLERGRGVHHGGEAWPEIGATTITQFRNRRADELEGIKTKRFSLATGTGMALAQQQVRELTRQAEALDRTIQSNNEAIWQMQAEGIQFGYAYPVQEPPDIIEPEFTVDGRLPATIGVRLAPQPLGSGDPRVKLYFALLKATTTLYREWSIVMNQIATIGGINDHTIKEDDASSNQQHRLEAARSTLERLLGAARAGTGEPARRRGSPARTRDA